MNVQKAIEVARHFQNSGYERLTHSQLIAVLEALREPSGCDGLSRCHERIDELERAKDAQTEKPKDACYNCLEFCKATDKDKAECATFKASEKPDYCQCNSWMNGEIVTINGNWECKKCFKQIDPETQNMKFGTTEKAKEECDHSWKASKDWKTIFCRKCGKNCHERTPGMVIECESLEPVYPSAKAKESVELEKQLHQIFLKYKNWVTDRNDGSLYDSYSAVHDIMSILSDRREGVDYKKAWDQLTLLAESQAWGKLLFDMVKIENECKVNR